MRPQAPGFDLNRTSTSPLRRLFTAFGIVLATTVIAGCQPPTPAQKASEAARMMNLNARWGKMEEAAGRTDPKETPEFLQRRSTWQDEIRIVDTELAGLNMKDATHATVEVDVSWNFDDDPTLRKTRLSQEWSDAEGKWVMVSEKRIGGDPGLFGEEVKRLGTSRDKHFPSRVIH